MKQNYNYTFGILSGFGIVFVVLGHTGSQILSVEGLFDYYSFHMPLFFFISGYFFDQNSLQNILSHILKKAKKLLVPFYFYHFLYLLLHSVIVNKTVPLYTPNAIGNTFSWYNLFISPWVSDQPIGFNVSTWFLIALFITEMINVFFCWTLKKLHLQNEWIKLFLGLLICIIGISLIQNNAVGFLKIIARSMYCFFFFRLGSWYKAYGESRDTICNTLYFALIIIVQFLLKMKYGYLGVGIYGGVDFDCLPVLLIPPITGILFWLRVAKVLTPILKTCKWFIYMAQNTMPIMIHHLFAIFVLQSLFFVIHLNTSYVSDFDVSQYTSNVYYLYAPEYLMRTLYAIIAIALVLLCHYYGQKFIKCIQNKFKYAINS